MKKKKNPKKIVMQAVKASRKQSREEEIKTYGKLLNFSKVAVSKKIYNRKKTKAENRNDNLPFFKKLP
jgi:hypothetical protein